MTSFPHGIFRKLAAAGRSKSSFIIFIGIITINAFIQTSSFLPSHFSNNELKLDFVLDVDQVGQQDIYSQAGVTSAVAASRLERMKMYRERYNYKAPISYHSHAERDEICGTGPDYDKFFAMNEYKRSANDEDKTIYEMLFKQPRGDGGGGEEEEDDPTITSATAATRGRIVEMGAYNGIQESNSRFFDTCLGWETLLVEANPLNWQKLVNSRPHAHRFSFAPSCSEEDERMNKTVKFDKYPMTNAGVADGSVTTSYTARNYTVDVPCGSLTKVLLDVFPGGHVSFFSLDVEGAEPFVLENIDFDKVFIEVLMVENRNNFCGGVCESRDRFRRIMDDNGYILFPRAVEKSDLFIHPLSQYLVERLERINDTSN